VSEPIELGGCGGRGGALPSRRTALSTTCGGSVSIDAFESNEVIRRLLERLGGSGCTPRAGLALDSPIPARLPAVASDYVVEKLVVAVESLAVSTAPIQQRLRNAWMDALVHLRPDDFDDPRERALFSSITDAVTAKGGALATTDSMSDGQAHHGGRACRVAPNDLPHARRRARASRPDGLTPPELRRCRVSRGA
jgi:hypothetical protein